MKILLVGWGYPPNIDGGLDIAVKELFQGLKDRNVEVDLILPEERSPDEDNIISVEVEGDMLSKASQMSTVAAKKASEYDIIHTHDWFGAESGFKASKYSDTKWVATFHSLSSSRSRNPTKELEELEEIALENANSVTAVSDKLSQEIMRKYGEKPLTVYNGFSKPENGKNIDIDTDKPIFFYIGRHAEQKGIEHLLYGFKKYLENNEGFLILGGDGHLTEALKDFVEILEIDGNVRFEGFIPDKELEGYYKAADVFVSPSINEPFGLTISEALSCGTRVVCTESGINELIPGEYVTLIEPNSDSISKGLEESLNSEPIEVEGRKWEEMVEDYLEVYQGLVN